MNATMNIYRSVILLCVFFVCYHQCVGKTKSDKQITDTAASSMYEKLDNYLHALSSTLSVKNYDAIIYLSDGECLSCTKSFSDFICQHILNESRMLIILNAKGEQFNTSPYLSDTVKNVVTDYSNDFFRLKIASSRISIIILKENGIDIYPVKLETLSDQMALLARMKYRKKK